MKPNPIETKPDRLGIRPHGSPCSFCKHPAFNACHVGAWLEILNSKTNKVSVQLLPYLHTVAAQRTSIAMATADQVLQLDAAAQQMRQRLQLQLDAAAEQMRVLSNAHDVLRQESGNAIMELRRILADEQQRNAQQSGVGKDKAVNFVNSKNFDGGKISGAKSENYKPWAKRVKVYCNAQCRGFRQALETAEAASSKVNAQD